MNQYSVNGILFDIPNEVKYFKFIKSNENSVSVIKDLIIFKFVNGINAGDYANLVPGLTSIYPDLILVPYIISTEIKFDSFDINIDNELIKICHEDINLIQLRYKIPQLKLIRRYFNLTILLGTESEFTIDDYYDELLNTGLFKLVNKCSKDDLGNVEIHNCRSNRIKSSRVYLPLSKYQEYRISALDYISDFFNKMYDIFHEYGFELVEYQKSKDTSTNNIVLFRINTHAKEFIKRVVPKIPQHGIMYSGSRISFTLMTPDTNIYEDFRMRYNNLDIVQNHREFKCKDKYDKEWRYDCIWTQSLDDEFSHEYPSNNLNTYGYQFNFNATLEFFDVYDEHYEVIREVLVTENILSGDGTNITNERSITE